MPSLQCVSHSESLIYWCITKVSVFLVAPLDSDSELFPFAFLHFVAMQELRDWLSNSELFPYAFLHSIAMQELCSDWLK